MGRAPTDNDYVVPSMRGRRTGQPRNGSTSNRSFRDDCTLLGLRSRHIYCARHSFITLTQEDGGDGTVLRWITHAPPSTAYDSYSREQWGRLCRELGKLSIALPTVGEGTPAIPASGEGAVEGPPTPSPENTLADTLADAPAVAQNPSNQGISGGSTEESNGRRVSRAVAKRCERRVFGRSARTGSGRKSTFGYRFGYRR